MSAVYAFFIAVFVYNDIALGRSRRPDREREITVMLMFIIANAFMFAFLLTTEQIPQSGVRMDNRVWGCRYGVFCWF